MPVRPRREVHRQLPNRRPRRPPGGADPAHDPALVESLADKLIAMFAATAGALRLPPARPWGLVGTILAGRNGRPANETLVTYGILSSG